MVLGFAQRTQTPNTPRLSLTKNKQEKQTFFNILIAILHTKTRENPCIHTSLSWLVIRLLYPSQTRTYYCRFNELLELIEVGPI